MLFFFLASQILSCCNSKLNSLRNQVSSAFSGSYLACVNISFLQELLMQIFSKNFYFANSTERISVNSFNADKNYLLLADALLVKVLLWLRFR